MRIILIINIIIFFSTITNAQRLGLRRVPHDAVKLNDRALETGKIIRKDSIEIVLRKRDRSEKIIPMSQIDSIYCLRCKIWYAAPTLGLYTWNRVLTQRLDTIGGATSTTRLAFGRLRNQRWGWNGSVEVQNSQKIKMVNWRLGSRYYFWGRYMDAANLYTGLGINYFRPSTNINRGIRWEANLGFEHLLFNYVRVYAEAAHSFQLAQFPKARYGSLVAGVRMSISR